MRMQQNLPVQTQSDSSFAFSRSRYMRLSLLANQTISRSTLRRSTRLARCQAGIQSQCDPGKHICQSDRPNPSQLTVPVESHCSATGLVWPWRLMRDGGCLVNVGAWLRLEGAAMTDNIPVLLAVAKSASSGRVCASQRRACALTVYGLRRLQNCQLPAARVRDGRR